MALPGTDDPSATPRGQEMTETDEKPIEKHFADWFSHVFGFGYGTGDEHFIVALQTFMATLGKGGRLPHGYDYKELETALTAPTAWLLINTLCGADIIEYGTSPRYGWLDPKGEALKAFMDGKTTDELLAATETDENDGPCYPDICNCGPEGYSPGKLCHNPFWNERPARP